MATRISFKTKPIERKDIFIEGDKKIREAIKKEKKQWKKQKLL